MAGLAFGNDLQCQVEWLVLWRRVAGGLNGGQQRDLYQKYGALLAIGGKKTTGRLNRQVEHEGWRLLASLEHLPAPWRADMGDELLARIKKEPADKSWLWSLGRLGARIPLYGPLNSVIGVGAATQWLEALLALPEFTPETASAVVSATLGESFPEDRPHKLTTLIPPSEYRSPAATPFGATSLSHAKSSADRVISRAAKFSSKWDRRRVPGIGMTSSP